MGRVVWVGWWRGCVRAWVGGLGERPGAALRGVVGVELRFLGASLSPLTCSPSATSAAVYVVNCSFTVMAPVATRMFRVRPWGLGGGALAVAEGRALTRPVVAGGWLVGGWVLGVGWVCGVAWRRRDARGLVTRCGWLARWGVGALAGGWRAAVCGCSDG